MSCRITGTFWSKYCHLQEMVIALQLVPAEQRVVLRLLREMKELLECPAAKVARTLRNVKLYRFTALRLLMS